MTIVEKISDEKQQHDVNREAEKISTLLPGDIDEYEYATDKEILSSQVK